MNCDPSADGPCAILGVDRNIKTPYVANWNLNIQHAFTPTSVLQIAYVGNRGIKLYSVRDINQDSWLLDWQANGSDPDHSVWDGQSGRPFTNPAICGTHCYPSLSYVDMLENKDSSIYHGLQVTFTQKPMHGLDFVAGYTWAKALDDYSGNRSFAWENAYDPLLEWGPANSDIRHRLTLAMTYSVPHAQRWDALLGGWQFSNIVNLETGEPQDYYDGSDYFSATESGNRSLEPLRRSRDVQVGFQWPAVLSRVRGFRREPDRRSAMPFDRGRARLARHPQLRGRLLHLEAGRHPDPASLGTVRNPAPK